MYFLKESEVRMRIVVIGLLILIGGCEKSSEKEIIKSKDGTVAIKGDRVDVKTKDGSLTIGAHELPEGFKISVLKGADVESSTRMSQPDGLEVYQLSITTAASVADVAEYYEKLFKERGVSVGKTEQSDQDSKMIMLIGNGDAGDANAIISRDNGSDQTSATISWSERKK